MNEIIFEVREDEADGGFVARALGHSIVTQADTWEELRDNVQEAVRCHFDEGEAPRIIRLHRVMDEVLTLA
jgi:predicted RNase H-like HicB family nuclease